MIAPENTINYYNSVSHAGGAESQRSIRLFMAPGMGHCSGGDGPYALDWAFLFRRFKDCLPVVIANGEISAILQKQGNRLVVYRGENGRSRS